jgi:hypothetical protein
MPFCLTGCSLECYLSVSPKRGQLVRFSTILYGFYSSAVAIVLPYGARADSVATQVLAVGGTPAPGTGNGVSFGYLGPPTLNSRGDAAFSAVVHGPGINSFNSYGMWVARRLATSAPLSLAYRGVDSTGYLSYLPNPSFNAAGEFVFWTTSGSIRPYHVLVAGVPGQFHPIVTSGDPAPGIGGGVLIQGRDVQASPRINDAGDIIFDAELTQTPRYPRNLGKFVVRDGAVEPIVYSGSPAPGLPQTTLKDFNSAVQSGNGHIAFVSNVTDLSAHAAVWVGTPDALVSPAAVGQQISTPLGNLSIAGFPALAGVNDAGLGAFTASLKTGSTSWAGGVLAFDARDGLRPVALPGMSIPVLGDGVVVTSAQGYEVNNRGEVVVGASLAGADSLSQPYGAVLVWKAGTLRPALKDGDAAPGLDAAIKVASVVGQNLTNAGQFLITAKLTGPGVDATNNSALWAIDSLGHFQLIARTGATLTIDGAKRVVKQVTLSMPYNQEAAAPAMNDAGQVAYQFTFTDGSIANMLATLPSVIPGDADNSLAVDIKDFDILADHYGQPGTRVDGDFDYDGSVTFQDFEILRGNFGRAYDGTSVPVSDDDRAALDAFAENVPEPSGAVVLLIMTVTSMTLRARGRRRRAVA